MFEVCNLIHIQYLVGWLAQRWAASGRGTVVFFPVALRPLLPSRWQRIVVQAWLVAVAKR